MKAVLELFRDGKRSQHGGILSGVLIMTAFVAIIAGALMTELSGNFLLASSLMSRTAAQATINSSVELSLSQLQSSQLDAPCPNLSSATLNNLTASA
ncbi:MAG TPA: hypothetical protein VNA65_07770, partial [Candidatus Dormibacteraeota bacterium]|nr:hypothetical protein [Candidatus Dormibacteraeota bacterium]